VSDEARSEGGAVELPGGWYLERRTGDAASLHAAPVRPRRTVRVHSVDRPAVVLGSTQPLGDVDAAAAQRRGVDVVRRRSGGGAVYLAPGSQVWVDVVVPSGDPLHDDDVERAAWWVGEWWAAALAGLGGAGGAGGAGGGGDGRSASDAFVVHRSSLGDRAAGRIACFAALGPGEVATAADGSSTKVVGISQRRTRHAARFQTVAHTRWDAGDLLGLLVPAASAQVDAALRHRVAPVGGGTDGGGTVDAELLLDVLLRTLPA
jgi:lipoate-protein ligase A